MRHDGIQLAYHNHNFEMKKYNGVTTLEILMNHTSRDNLKLEMDAAWVSPLGEGLLDWSAILPAAKANGVRWFIIEHDKPKDAWSIITTSLKNLRAALQTLPH